MKKYFLNCTNHPSEKWDEAQRNAALKLAEQIIDLPFPNIPAAATYDDITSISREYTKKIFDIGENDAVCLLQGEMTVLCFMAEQSGYKESQTDIECYGGPRAIMQCYTACSERRCTENPDGTRTYLFEFVQFRPSFTLCKDL